jgi:hypothetical protein
VTSLNYSLGFRVVSAGDYPINALLALEIDEDPSVFWPTIYGYLERHSLLAEDFLL